MLDRIEALERTVREDPDDLRSRLKLGDAYVQAGRRADALAHYLVVARAYARLGFALKALAVFRECMGLGADVRDEALEQAHALGLGDESVEPIELRERKPLN